MDNANLHTDRVHLSFSIHAVVKTCWVQPRSHFKTVSLTWLTRFQLQLFSMLPGKRITAFYAKECSVFGLIPYWLSYFCSSSTSFIWLPQTLFKCELGLATGRWYCYGGQTRQAASLISLKTLKYGAINAKKGSPASLLWSEDDRTPHFP